MTEKFDVNDYIRSYEERRGKCMECGERIAVEWRTYRRADKTEFSHRVRTRCDCPGYRTDRVTH